MAKPEDIKKQLAKKVNAVQEKPKTFGEQFKNYLAKIAPSVKTVLPKQFDTERFLRIALSEVRRNPQLSQCSIESLGGAIMQSAILGLEPGLHGYAYLVPRWNSKAGRFDAEFQIGYKGYIDLAHRTGKVAFITAEIVYEDDYFEFQYGTNQKLIHKPNIESEKYGDPEYAKKYYAYIKFKDGSEQFKVITKKQALRHAQRFTTSKNKEGELVGPWKTDFDAMALKTAIKLLFKTVQVSTEFQQQIAKDETIANDPDNVQSVYEVIDMEQTEQEQMPK
ncbi:recombination protein RecT [Thermolongibacillus altinsuensis]|uniref:Recombination protein RecT n=1 Tax=Thermolongibacillus altinsuensis TaxID=575256 RepID=A0A4R1QLF2_9BACL|nr:recombinase RecT [Thermolongibacillus altinsuensis]TCL47014.1 recombination protein RecT [Thermolongibacillus altinsuensis]